MVCYFCKIFFVFYFFYRDRREEKEKRNTDVREEHQLVASHMRPSRDQTRNPGMCPERG